MLMPSYPPGWRGFRSALQFTPYNRGPIGPGLGLGLDRVAVHQRTAKTDVLRRRARDAL